MTGPIDYTAMLYQWRADNVPNADRIKADEYHSDVTGKDTLVITAGDSWTYGESLGDTRLSDVYGCKVRQSLDADWINIGLPGRSNSYVIKNLAWLIQQIDLTQYKKIFAIVTLTENGREPSDTFATSIDFVRIHAEHQETTEFYNELLREAEREWGTWLNRLASTMPSNCNLVVGQNFVWHQDLVDNLSNSITVLQSNWIEKLAEYQQMSLPPRARLVTGWIFDSVKAIHNMFPTADTTVFKTWSIPYIEQATEVNNWLSASDLNNIGGSKHPIAQGHQIWADYILGHLNVD